METISIAINGDNLHDNYSSGAMGYSVLMNQMLVRLRKEGKSILGYRNDLVIWNSNKEMLEAQVEKIIKILQVLGLTINRE